MRISVTLDADAEALVRGLRADRGISFDRTLNDAIRASAATPRPRGSVTRRRRMGAPTLELDRALVKSGNLEDVDLVRRLWAGE